MANIKSAQKRIETTKTKTAQNRVTKSEIATAQKKFRAALEAKKFDEAQNLLNTVFGLLDGAAQDNTIHKNKADRDKARYSKMLASAKGAK